MSKKLSKEGLKYKVCSVKIEGEKISIDGFISFLSKPVEALQIYLVSKNRRIALNTMCGSAVSQNEKARVNPDCLFSARAELRTFKSMNIVATFVADKRKWEVKIGRMRNGFLTKIKLLLSKINKENIKRAIDCIKTGKFFILKSFFVDTIQRDLTLELPQVDINEWLDEHISAETANGFICDFKADIIVPVYNGYEYFDALFESVKRTRADYRLIVIDDCSPDERVYPYLEKKAKEDKRIILLKNEKNLGFVSTVNRGLEMAENHVVLLNTDVEVPNGWLERLISPILEDSDVASVTPFSNAATICSFPDIGKDSKIFGGLSVGEVDGVFSKFIPEYTEMPTGVGFCMAMNIDAVKKVGLLDIESFSRGYCEENDWCQRAIKSGFKNVHAENLFAYHKHGGSFASAEKKMLCEENMKKLLKKHPDYMRDVAEYFNILPTKTFSEVALMALVGKIYGGVSLWYDHSLGGGATVYLKKKTKMLSDSKKPVITVFYSGYFGCYIMTYSWAGYTFRYHYKEFSEIESLLNICGLSEITVNEVVFYKDLEETLDGIVALKLKFGAKITYLLHDYYSVCPSLNLLDGNGVHCGGCVDSEKCRECISGNRFSLIESEDVSLRWRDIWSSFFQSVDSITAFSGASAEIFERTYGFKDKLTIIPHRVDYMLPIKRERKLTKTFNIGLMGALAFHKGLNIVKGMAEYIEANNLNIRIVLIGSSAEHIGYKCFEETGAYKQEDIASLTLKHDIDMFLIPSIWPETFSYTTSEAMALGLPVACFDMGAPAERVSAYEKGLILKSYDPEKIVESILEFSEKDGVKILPPEEKNTVLMVIEEVSFATRYRCEHLEEQLLGKGIRFEYVLSSKVKDIDLSQFAAVIMYRCLYNDNIEWLIENARESGLSIFYDVDDYVFDYDAISYLEFLKGKTYKGFRAYCEGVDKVIKKSDYLITSTEVLRGILSEKYTDKEIFMNRNTFSATMFALSQNASADTVRGDDTVSIGYFSGTKTHDKDFAAAKEGLLRVMRENPKVRLKIGGCLNLPDEFSEFSERIDTFDFKDFRELPAEIATVDINLLPLEDTVFQHCKSENKWIEAAILKIPTVMSANPELLPLFTDGKEALFCFNDEDWYQALNRLTTDKEYRLSVGEKAYKKALRNYAATAVISEAAQKIIEVLSKEGER